MVFIFPKQCLLLFLLQIRAVLHYIPDNNCFKFLTTTAFISCFLRKRLFLILPQTTVVMTSIPGQLSLLHRQVPVFTFLQTTVMFYFISHKGCFNFSQDNSPKTTVVFLPQTTAVYISLKAAPVSVYLSFDNGSLFIFPQNNNHFFISSQTIGFYCFPENSCF